MSEVKDFDAAWEEAGGDSELEAVVRDFILKGETFTANLSPRAGEILRWMGNSNRLEMVPQLLRTFLSDEGYDRLLTLDIPWQRLDPVVTWLAEEMAGVSTTGNGEG